MLTVDDFLAEHEVELQDIPTARLTRDQEDYRHRFLPHMANDMLLKRILANDYGSPCDFRLAKLCREWVVRKQTEGREAV